MTHLVAAASHDNKAMAELFIERELTVRQRILAALRRRTVRRITVTLILERC